MNFEESIDVAPGKIQSLVITCRRLDRLHGGAALRNSLNVRALSQLGPVDVITVGPSEPAPQVDGVRHYEHVARNNKRTRLERLASKRWVVDPIAHPMINTHYQESARQAIRERLAAVDYDLAVVEELALVRYIRELRRGRCRTVFDAHNIESALSGDMTAMGSAPRVRRSLARFKDDLLNHMLSVAEAKYVSSYDRIWTCSEPDRRGFHELLEGPPPIDVVPNAIDVRRYRRPEGEGSGDWSGQPMTIVYLGAYSYVPNELAALELIETIMPLLRARAGEARLRLIGAGPTEAMKAAAAGWDDIEITGSVDSILPYIQQPCVLTLPIRLGGGTRLKILEAFAAGCLVVSTAKGAEGIEAQDGEHLMVRESSENIAEAALRAWHEPELRLDICRRASLLVSERYSLESTVELVARSVKQEVMIPCSYSNPAVSAAHQSPC